MNVKKRLNSQQHIFVNDQILASYKPPFFSTSKKNFVDKNKNENKSTISSAFEENTIENRETADNRSLSKRKQLTTKTNNMMKTLTMVSNIASTLYTTDTIQQRQKRGKWDKSMERYNENPTKNCDSEAKLMNEKKEVCKPVVVFFSSHHFILLLPDPFLYTQAHTRFFLSTQFYYYFRFRASHTTPNGSSNS